MAKIGFEGQEYLSRPGETVLDCLTRNGVSVNSSCRAGVCQTCIMVAVSGDPTIASQAGLKDTLKAQNYFLICSCVPDNDLLLDRPDTNQARIETQVISLLHMSVNVVQLRLKRPPDYNYQAGQFLNLYKDHGVSRSYSLASVPATDDFLELHIREIPQGQVSGWVGKLCAGDKITISHAMGQCIYLPVNPEQHLLLVGTGTGLAPLYGIVRDALNQGHSGPIHLYHGSSNSEGLYLVDELSTLADTYPQFHFHPSVSQGSAAGIIRQGRADVNALADFPDLTGWRVFLCGNEAMVKGMQRKAFLAGASMAEIFADPFVRSRES